MGQQRFRALFVLRHWENFAPWIMSKTRVRDGVGVRVRFCISCVSWIKSRIEFIERRLFAVIYWTGNAKGKLVPVLLRIMHWPRNGLPISSPWYFLPWLKREFTRPRSRDSSSNSAIAMTTSKKIEAIASLELALNLALNYRSTSSHM